MKVVFPRPAQARNGCRHRSRPLIAFFDAADVFEDFSRHHGVDQRWFATQWSDTANHALLSVLQKKVGDVVWYTFSLRPEIREATHSLGFRVRIFPSSWLHRCLWRAFYLPRAAWRWQRFYRSFAIVASYVAPASVSFVRALRQERPDFLFVQSDGSGRVDLLLLAARLLGVPLIAYQGAGQNRGWPLRQWMLRRADLIIAADRAERDRLVAAFKVPSDRIPVILPPIDTDTFRPLERALACRAAGLDPQRRYILFVGRLARAGRVDSLIRAFGSLAAQFPDVDLVIAGGGPALDALHKAAAVTTPTRVRFLGWIPERERLCCLYNAATCLALPSLRDGFAMVVGEAAACGTPIVASDVGGARELVIEGETGFTIRPGDDAGLQTALIRILSDTIDLTAMHQRARELALARVSPAVVAAALRECFLKASPVS